MVETSLQNNKTAFVILSLSLLLEYNCLPPKSSKNPLPNHLDFKSPQGGDMKKEFYFHKNPCFYQSSNLYI